MNTDMLTNAYEENFKDLSTLLFYNQFEIVHLDFSPTALDPPRAP